MSADGKVVIQVELDWSALGSSMEKAANAINREKLNIKAAKEELKHLNAEMSTASKSAAKEIEEKIKTVNYNLEESKKNMSTFAASYKEDVLDIISSGATSKEALGKTFFANLTNLNMTVPKLNDLIESGKVMEDVRDRVEALRTAREEEARAAAYEAEIAREAAYANPTPEMQAEMAEMREKTELLKRIGEEYDNQVAKQNELARAILETKLAYDSGKLSPYEMKEASASIAVLAEDFNKCSLTINRLAGFVDELGAKNGKLQISTDDLASNFDKEAAATAILDNKIKDLNKDMYNNETLQSFLSNNVVRVTAEMRAEEAQVRRNAEAQREAERAAAMAEREAKGRITGTIGLLGMINPAFSRLSYAVRQFGRIGGMSFKGLEDKILKFGKALKALPPQVKIAMGAIVATVGTTVSSLVLMAKTLKTIIGITKKIGSLALKASKAFLNFYDFDEYFGDVDKMIEAYNDLQESETALAALMKSRMGATNEAVNSIKELIGAEEAEGVVSRQNQTAALKQLAAYTTRTESLETLLPVLNDFTVQMYGVNATEKESISAAKLFGKAMKGQTETLRRSGYVTEAQAQAIKSAADETERAALLAKYMGERCGDMNAILAQTDSGQQRKLANSMAEVQREFGQAASVLKTAFIPIATQVLAILARLASYAAALAQSIGRLFGRTGAQAAVAAGQIEDVAEATSDVGGAAKKASDDLGTMGFDELNNLTSKQDSGGGAEAGGGIDPALVEENTGLIDELSSSLDRLLEKMKNAYVAGFMLGTALREALEHIPWDDIKQKAYEAGTTIANFFNGILDSKVIEQIGTTLGEGINTIVSFFNGFLDNFDFASLGTQIANGLENMFNTIDWKAVGHLFSQAFIGIFTTVNNFLESFDWGSIGRAVGNFLCGINWLEVLGQVIELAINILGLLFIDLPVAIISLLGTVIDNVVQAMKENFDKNLEEAGGNVIAALLLGMLDNLKTIASWVWEHVVSPIIMAFAKYFGVNSDEFKEFGENVIEGFFNGIRDFVKDPFGWIEEHIFNPIVNAFKDLFKINSPSKVMEKIGEFVGEGLFDGIKSMTDTITTIWNTVNDVADKIWNKISKSLSGIVDNMKSDIEKKWNLIKTIITTVSNAINTLVTIIWNTIKTTISTVITTIQTILSTIWGAIQTNISTVLNNISNNITTVWSAIQTTITTVINAVQTVLSTVWSSILTNTSTIVNSMLTAVTTAFNSIGTVADTVFNAMNTSVVGIFNNMKEGIRTAINTIIGFVEAMANGVISSINTIITALNSISITPPAWAQKKFGIGALSFNIPTLHAVSIPRLAEGGVIPPNREFMAILGDQKHGTNIEAPLDTIVEAVNKAGGAEEIRLLREQNKLLSQILAKDVTISSRDIFNSTRSEAQDFFDRNGVSPYPI